MPRPTPPEPQPVAGLIAALDVSCSEELMTRALTHRSYAYENGGLPTNERLEFLGDAVLGLVVTDSLYHRYPDLPEGQLAKLRASIVNMRALAGVARTIGAADPVSAGADGVPSGLGAYIHLGRGEQSTGGHDKPSILADTLEAVIGATYVDGGITAATRLVLELFQPLLTGSRNPLSGFDWKTALQESSAVRGLGPPGVRRRRIRPRPRKRIHRRRPPGGAAARRGCGQQQEGGRTAGRGRCARRSTGRGPGRRSSVVRVARLRLILGAPVRRAAHELRSPDRRAAAVARLALTAVRVQ